jgi:hypothetical protein
MHLWEYDHPHYCTRNNNYEHRYIFHHNSWKSFLEKMGDFHEDMNLLFRWDWIAYSDGGHVLYLFYILQREGIFGCWYIDVKEEDEPAIKEWLTTKLNHLLKLWEPLEKQNDS